MPGSRRQASKAAMREFIVQLYLWGLTVDQIQYVLHASVYHYIMPSKGTIVNMVRKYMVPDNGDGGPR